ncbi:MAG: type II toxin-antitoxin system PemK/MazF family toxin [Nanoarchaeota archaeon]|nr:type II toxin-antitoxin system PemK/MazF family toxin [Nanoarchaeota archaeon]
MKKGDVFLVDIPRGRGYEQRGFRPAILVTGVNCGIVSMIPLSTNINALRYPYTLIIKKSEINNLNRNSVALIFQLRGIDLGLLFKKIGEVDKGVMDEIDKLIKEMFDIKL